MYLRAVNLLLKKLLENGLKNMPSNEKYLENLYFIFFSIICILLLLHFLF